MARRSYTPEQKAEAFRRCSDELKTALERRDWDAIDCLFPELFWSLDMVPEDLYPVVYFIQVPSGPIKIGTSKNLKQRLAYLQVYTPEPISLLGVHVGSFVEERAAHERFAHLRLHGEWFESDPALLAYIAAGEQAAPVGAGMQRLAWWAKQGQDTFACTP